MNRVSVFSRFALTGSFLCLSAIGFSGPSAEEVTPWKIPGLEVVDTLDGVCPRDAALEIDLEGEHHETALLCAGFQPATLGFKSYLAPGSADNPLGAPVTGEQLRSIMLDNRNFTHAGLVDRESGGLLWDFSAQKMIHQSKLLPGGRMLIAASHDGYVYALDMVDGHVLWKVQPQGEVLEFAAWGERLFVVTSENALHAYSIQDGWELWQRPVETRAHSPYFTWLIADDHAVFVSSSSGSVTAFDPTEGFPIWTFATEGTEFSLKALHEGILVLGRDDELVGLDATRGKRLWRLQTQSGSCCARLVHLDCDRFMTAHYTYPRQLNLDLLAFEATTGNELWRLSKKKLNLPLGLKIVEPTDINPLGMAQTLAVQHDETGTVERLFVTSRVDVTAIDAIDGTLAWTAPVKGSESILLSHGMLFTEGRKGTIRALDPATGRLRWQHVAGERTFDMQRVGDTLLVELESDRLLALSATDGAFLQNLDTGGSARLVAAGEDRVIVCGSPVSWVLAPESKPKRVSRLAEEDRPGNGLDPKCDLLSAQDWDRLH